MNPRASLVAIICIITVATPAYAALPPTAATNSHGNPDIQEMIDRVNESMVHEYLEELVSFGPRYTGSDNCSAAARWIHDEFTAMGLHTRLHEWSYAGYSSQNVVATLNGSSDSEIILSAHYDTVPRSPGANDDGSGVASLLAAAEVMRTYTFSHTIRFIAFSGEEVGTYGSYTYARQAYQRGDRIRAVVNLDMIGYADTAEGGTTARMFCPDRAAWLADFSQSVTTRYPALDMSVEVVPNYRGADHQAFVDYGYDAAFYAHVDGYPWGHSANDTLDHINASYHCKATRLFTAIAGELTLQEVPLQVRLTAPREGQLYLGDLPLLQISGGRLWYTGLRGATVLLGSATAAASVEHEHPVERVTFCIDDIFISWDSSPPYQWRIQGKHAPPLGRHTLRVVAYDTQGNVATDEMDIHIVTLAYQYAPWT
ncbi:MAG: M20/M25/M40 family metallo-hydrolase [Thermoplasmatota archaeon]